MLLNDLLHLQYAVFLSTHQYCEFTEYGQYKTWKWSGKAAWCKKQNNDLYKIFLRQKKLMFCLLVNVSRDLIFILSLRQIHSPLQERDLRELCY